MNECIKCCQICSYAIEDYEDVEGGTILVRKCEKRNGALVDDDDCCENFEF